MTSDKEASRSLSPDEIERREAKKKAEREKSRSASNSPSPRRKHSPSPRKQSRSPRRRSRSPRKRSRSPRRHSRSPKRYSRSPKRRDDRRKKRSRSRERRRNRSRSRSPKRARRESPKKQTPPPPQPKKEPVDILRSKAGGAYIPPAKLKLMQEQMTDKSGEQYQRMNWERLKKKMHGLVNKINTGNLVPIVRELLQENVIRGKGLLARSIIQAQAFSPVFSNVYAALVAVINSKFPHVGELVLRRLVVQFKRSFRRNDKGTTVSVSKFIAHLINQQVAHELLALEIMMLMLESPTEDSVEVAIAFLKECGSKLQEVAPRALDSVFARLRDILNDNTGQRIQYMIEAVMIIRKDKFKAYPIVIEELDLIDEDDQTTHTMSLEDAVDPENGLNVFKLDPDFEKNEAMYDEIRREIIGDVDDSDEEQGGEEDAEEEEENEQDEAAAPTTTEIIDSTEQNLVAFRREVYLTIQSSLDYQEAAHKLLKMNIKPELEVELCHMLVDCCTQSRTYERFYGLLCERFCRLKKEFQDTFEQVARDTYATVHRFEITKLRNIARLISHLLFTDAISWMVLSEIKLTEEDTTSSGRIYIKYIFQELVESMGLAKLYERIKDPTMQTAFDGIFPRDNPQNSRFSINFFTLIGLGGLTIDLREYLEKGAKKKKETIEEEDSSSSSSDSSDSSDSDSDTSDSSDGSSSDSSSSSSDSEDDRKKNNKKKKIVEKSKEKPSQEHNKENKHADKKIKEEPVSPERTERRRNRSPEARKTGTEEKRDERRKRDDNGDRRNREDDGRRRDRTPQRDRSRNRYDEKEREKRKSPQRNRDRERVRNDDDRRRRRRSNS